MPGQVLLGPGNRGREERDVREVAENNHRQERAPSSVNPPTEHAIRHLQGKSPHRCAIVQTQAQGQGTAWPEDDVPRMCQQVENEMREDPDSDGPAEQWPAKSLFNGKPGQQRRARGRGD